MTAEQKAKKEKEARARKEKINRLLNKNKDEDDLLSLERIYSCFDDGEEIPSTPVPMKSLMIASGKDEQVRKEESAKIIYEFFVRCHKRKKAKAMWKELNSKYSGLPRVAKVSFVKMWIMRQDNRSLKQKVTGFFLRSMS